MALNIKNPYVESLLAEVALITGESKTEAVRKALEERRQRCFLDCLHDGKDLELLTGIFGFHRGSLE